LGGLNTRKSSTEQTKLSKKKSRFNGAVLGFEEKLWKAANKLRNNMDAAEYKHMVLGLIFLKYISDAFTEVYEEVKSDPEGSGSTGSSQILELQRHFANIPISKYRLLLKVKKIFQQWFIQKG
jgi:type I restriction-modification system DNA methylase subunit